MASVQYGTGMTLGAVLGAPTIAALSAYWVESVTEGGVEADKEMVYDGADGSLETIIVHRKDAIVEFTCIPKSTATPATDFVEGTNITSTWFVVSAPVVKTKAPWKITVRLQNIGVS
jgi:hypothetical protein